MTKLREVTVQGEIYGSNNKLNTEPEGNKVSSQRRNDPRLRNNIP